MYKVVDVSLEHNELYARDILVLEIVDCRSLCNGEQVLACHAYSFRLSWVGSRLKTAMCFKATLDQPTLLGVG